jgi:hypothetical protein
MSKAKRANSKSLQLLGKRKFLQDQFSAMNVRKSVDKSRDILATITASNFSGPITARVVTERYNKTH